MTSDFLSVYLRLVTLYPGLFLVVCVMYPIRVVLSKPYDVPIVAFMTTVTITNEPKRCIVGCGPPITEHEKKSPQSCAQLSSLKSWHDPTIAVLSFGTGL